MSTMTEQLRNSLASMEGPAKLKSGLIRSANVIGELRLIFAADSVVSSWFLMYRDICLEVEAFFRRNASERRAEVELVRHYLYGSIGIILDPLALIGGIINKLDRAGLSTVVIEVADRYLEKGEKYINQALERQNLEEFGDALYTAGLYLFAALMMYKALVQDASQGVVIEKANYCKKALTVADEKITRVGHSLLTQVENSVETSFRWHCSRVQAAQQNGGQVAAQQVLFELIEMHYFYPRLFSKFLLGIRPSPYDDENLEAVLKKLFTV